MSAHGPAEGGGDGAAAASAISGKRAIEVRIVKSSATGIPALSPAAVGLQHRLLFDGPTRPPPDPVASSARPDDFFGHMLWRYGADQEWVMIPAGPHVRRVRLSRHGLRSVVRVAPLVQPDGEA